MRSTLLSLLLVPNLIQIAAGDAPVSEVDQFWTKIAESVSKGDFAAYRSAHHPDGVLVINGASYTMASAHQPFQRGFDDTAAGKVKAGIEFRWKQQSVSADTAFHAGAFRYWSEAGGVTYSQYTPIEVVLVKGGDGWKLLVQKQEKAITEAEWDALPDEKQDN